MNLLEKYYLQGKGKIILYVRISQIFDIPVGTGTAQSVEKHNLCSRLSVNFCYKLPYLIMEIILM